MTASSTCGDYSCHISNENDHPTHLHTTTNSTPPCLFKVSCKFHVLLYHSAYLMTECVCVCVAVSQLLPPTNGIPSHLHTQVCSFRSRNVLLASLVALINFMNDYVRVRPNFQQCRHVSYLTSHPQYCPPPPQYCQIILRMCDKPHSDVAMTISYKKHSKQIPTTNNQTSCNYPRQQFTISFKAADVPRAISLVTSLPSVDACIEPATIRGSKVNDLAARQHQLKQPLLLLGS